MRDLQHAQDVVDFLIPPAIAAGDGNAEDVDVFGLQDHQHGLEVGGSRAKSILIDDYLAATVCGARERGAQRHQHGAGGETAEPTPSSGRADHSHCDSNCARALATVTVAPLRSFKRRHSSAACPFASRKVLGPAP